MRSFFLSFVISLVPIFVFSQSKIEFGLKGGLNLSNIHPTAVNDVLDLNLPQEFSSASTIHFGTYVLWRFSKIGIQPEIMYSPHRTKQEYLGRSTVRKKAYLTVPVVAKFYLPGGINIQGGPQFGILASSASTGFDIQENGADVSALVGLGWESKIGLGTSIRYIYSMSNTNQNELFASKFSDIRNRVVQFSVEYRLFKK